MHWTFISQGHDLYPILYFILYYPMFITVMPRNFSFFHRRKVKGVKELLSEAHAQGGRAQHDFSWPGWKEPDISVEVDTARLATSRTDTVKKLPGYPVQNSPSGGFLRWGGTVGSGGVVYDIVWMWCPRRKPWTILRTPVCFLSYRRLSPQFQFLCLLLL